MDQFTPQQRLELLGGLLELLRDMGIEEIPETEEEILAMTGADRDEAYAVRDRLRAALPQLLQESEPRQDAGWRVVSTVLGYVMAHPGETRRVDGRLVATEEFRRLVVGLRQPGGPGEGMPLGEFARYASVPEAQLKEWLSEG